MRLPILHCHGSNNDFPLIDTAGLGVPEHWWPGIARALADRAGPVGGDGLLLLAPADAGADFAMRMFNPDGSESEQCLNGLRCVARAAFERDRIDRAVVQLPRSRATVARAPDLAPHVAAIAETAGPVSLAILDWPLILPDAPADGRLVDGFVPMLSDRRRFTAVAMPNPHLIAFVDAVDEDELVAIGRRCEAAPAWLPHRANVSFVADTPSGMFVRTFERGAGLTDSCGSATAAAAHAACLTGRAHFGEAQRMAARGGPAVATPCESEVTLVGNATWQWRGHVDWDPDAGLGAPVVDHRFADEQAAWARLVAISRNA